jgi:hypothetical protein
MRGVWARVEAVIVELIWFRSSKDGMRGSAAGASDCTVLAGFTPACKGALVESLASLLSSIFFRLRDIGSCRSFPQIFQRRFQ